MDRPDGPTAGDGDRTPRVQPQRRPRLSDAAIAEIAAEIVWAVPLPPPDDQSTWILASAAELPGEDEERVVRALARRRTDERQRRLG
jgi:hypothetical protein